MAYKRLKFSVHAHKEMLRGVDILADTVAATLGPGGRNVLIETGAGAPLLTKDGATVAKAITLANAFQNVGAKMMMEVASQTSDMAGDGTTTATLLGRSIFRGGIAAIASGMDPMDVKRGVDRAVAMMTSAIVRMSTPCRDTRAIARVGEVSANGDRSVGQLMASAIGAVGKEGVITVEAGACINDELNHVEGMQIGCGYMSPYFVSNSGTMSVVMDDPCILICAMKIAAARDLLPALDVVVRSGKPLLVIAEDFSNDALALLVVNNLRGTLRVAAIKAPGIGDGRHELLEDVAIVTGGTLISEKGRLAPVSNSLDELGRARSIVVTKSETTIIDGGGDAEAVASRVEQIRRLVPDAASDHERSKLEERVAKVSGGVAVISVGAATEVEMKERRARVEDALRATRAAVREGIVPGGGVALIRACQQSVDTQSGNVDQAAGFGIVLRAAEEPLRQIVKNCGGDPSAVLSRVKDGDGSFGFDATTEEFGDLMQMGIIDPTRVTRLALQNAASIAGLLLATDVLVTSIR